MRLTGGTHGGRRLQTLDGAGMRPTQDQVRAALCSALAGHFAGARVLDLFAGSGALGLEAWSRGAARVVWVEKDRAALRMLKANVAALGVPGDAGQVVGADVFRWLARGAGGEAMDLVLADPPYAEATAGGWMSKLAELLAAGGWVKPGGVWVYEMEERGAVEALPGWRLARDKRYGGTRLLFWELDR